MHRGSKLPERHRRVLDDAFAELDGVVVELEAAEREIYEQQVRIEDSARRLHAERLRYQSLFEFLPDTYLVTDPEGTILEANRSAEALLGVASTKLINQPLLQYCAAQDLPIVVQALQQLREHDRLEELELRVRRFGGAFVDIVLKGSVIRDQAGDLVAFGWLLRDATKRKRADEALQQYTERLKILHDIDRAILAARSPVEVAQAALTRLRQLVSYQRGGLLVIDARGYEATALMIDSSGELRVDTGFRLPFELFGDMAIVPDAEPEPMIITDPPPVVQALLANGVRSYMVFPLIAQGTLIGALCLGANQQDAFTPAQLDIASEVANSMAIALQQARLHEQISAGRERLRSLTRRLVETQEIERRQLAQELHDQVGQTLTALSISLRIAHDQLSPDSALRVGSRLVESTRLVEETIVRIRDVMAALRPAVLDDYGLAAALRWYVQQFSERTGLDVALHLGAGTDELRLAPEVETALFRVVQEALTNVVKHARAARARVAFKAGKRMLQLTVADRGVGFEPAAPQVGEHTRLGLIGMRERIEAVGGRLRVDSAPGRGTRVVVELER